MGFGLAVGSGVGAGVGIGSGVGLGEGLGLAVAAAVGVGSGVGSIVGWGVEIWSDGASTSPRTAPHWVAVGAAAVTVNPHVATTKPTETTNASPNSARAAAVAGVTVRVAVTGSTGAGSPTDPRR